MAPHSHSPRVSDRTSPRMAPHPMTPVHSPHHSVTSSISARTSIHNLSIHEYRKQQNTPNSQTATPSGKTLRRKAAAPALNGVQRAPATRSDSQPSSRPLHSSQSAHQLQLHRSPFQQQLLADQLHRAQSAEPRTQGGSVSSISTTTSTGKVGHFKSRKRLPKPPAVTGVLPFPSHLAIVTTTSPHRPPPPNTWDPSTERSLSSDGRTPHTTSTFSLSRFPKPPHLTDPSFSPPHNESKRTRIDIHSYASAAPATPPATPATLHYRGASFDLVNPHDSLLLHDIVTPSRDFGSSEYLRVNTSEELFLESADMAPKRPLYGDFGAAHAGILRRAGDSFSSSNLDLPLPPRPAAASSGSSAYTSPIYSPESDFAPPPLDLKKTENDSRFSLKQLTRTLTKRLGKAPEKQHERELQVLHRSHASISMDSDFPGPLQETSVATPQSAYFPISPTSPVSPTSPMSFEEQATGREHGGEMEDPRKFSMQRYDTEPLASLIPDNEYSTELGRVEEPRMSMSEGFLLSRPYYDDIESIYASSSVYTGDDRRKSNYQQSLAGTGQTNSFLRYSGMDAGSVANEYSQDSMYRYSSRSHGHSKPLSQDVYRRSIFQGKADTISKIIDQYDPNPVTDNTLSMQSQNTGEESPSANDLRVSRVVSGLGQFHEQAYTGDKSVPGVMVSPRKSRRTQDLGPPPKDPAPLAPPFEYGRGPSGTAHPESSGMFSNNSSTSYGDTRYLLQMPQGSSVSGKGLQPSSSYSQSGIQPLQRSSSYSQAAGSMSPKTPQEALDQADQIFQSAANDQMQEEKGIPAIWARRSSGSMLIAKRSSNPAGDNRKSYGSDAINRLSVGDGNDADWESVAGNSQGVRDSFESIADYSSSEGSRESLDLSSHGSLPSWTGQNHSQGPSIYSHPSPIRAHRHPFSSSPPQLRPGRISTAPESPSSQLTSSPPASRIVPVLTVSTLPEDVLGRGAVEQPYAFAPWTEQYAFSDKETQELLASGPNDDIMIDPQYESGHGSSYNAMRAEDGGRMPFSSSSVSLFDSPGGPQRENTFEKLCVVGPKGNLTGTPRGTGMHETGSSVADVSSPVSPLNSSVARGGFHSTDYPGFYASPFIATSSVTRIQQSRPPPEPEFERTPSQMTLYPRPTELQPVIETSPTAGAKHRASKRSSTTFQNAQRRASRTAVPGQTKLRQMILAPEQGRKTLSSADTNFSHFKSVSGRPSTSDTNTPLNPVRPQLSVGTFPTVRSVIAHQHSPHLLCPERATIPEDEERRRKLSWAILAVFCLLPPCIILYRVWGDQIMISLTKGHLGHCTSKSKRVALIGGIAVNAGIVTAIVVPIIVAHALGAA